jgi:hypothetical protein
MDHLFLDIEFIPGVSSCKGVSTTSPILSVSAVRVHYSLVVGTA